MPKYIINYDKTIFYKIICKNTIPDNYFYVGHTTNFTLRKQKHKSASKHENTELYKKIRENGGWDNWDMIIIDTIKCEDRIEAKKKEQEYYKIISDELNASNFQDKKSVKNLNNKYRCELCDFTTNKKTDYKRHLLTGKHRIQKTDIMENDVCEKTIVLFKCNKCKKNFKTNSGLWKHKNKYCYKEEEYDYDNEEDGEEEEEEEDEEDEEEDEDEEVNITDKVPTELVTRLISENNEVRDLLIKQMHTQIEENKEFRKTITEMIPRIGNNNNTINNKQKFNINVFLNEKCKDALNMSDFIQSIEISLEQLDFTKRQGLEQGLSNIIIENMNDLSVYQRPLHCTDTKRDTIYVKEDNKWEKDKDKSIIKKAINDISNKNYHTLKDWMDHNPDYLKIDEKQDFFARTISAIGKPLSSVDDKIIKRLCSKTYIKDDLE